MKVKTAKNSIRQKVFRLYSVIDRRIFYSQNYSSWLSDKNCELKYNSVFNKNKDLQNDFSHQEIKTKWGGANPQFINYDCPSLLDDSFKIYKNAPDKIAVLKDVIYLPQYHCLYTSEGLRIDSSCYRTKLQQTPKNITIPKELEYVNREFVYIGDYTANMHYGHFLIEAISSLWYLVKNPNVDILCHQVARPFKNTFIDIFFKALQTNKKRFFSLSSPCQIKTVIIPHPSMYFGTEGFQCHRVSTEKVAENILSHSNQKIKQTEQPLYLSRTKLKDGNRNIIGERDLEEKLRQKGVLIAYPEQLSLEEQIHLFNKHQVIIGCIGSALHGILFDIFGGKKMIYLSDKNRIDKSFLMIDAIKSLDSVYVGTLSQKESCVSDNWRIDRILNVDITTNALKQVNVL